jgi:mannose/fructose/N-acetylgalactosamine-specific phosphotransferase system component IIB
MPIVLLRIDERLIHGQIVVGWGNHLHPDRIVVVDDELAASDWEQELYVLGMPPSVAAAFESVADARRQLDEWRAAPDRFIVLTRDIATMRRLADGDALAGDDVNVGGIHYAPGRTAVLPYVYLSDAEREELSRLAASGARITARDLPGSRPVDLARLVGTRRS